MIDFCTDIMWKFWWNKINNKSIVLHSFVYECAFSESSAFDYDTTLPRFSYKFIILNVRPQKTIEFWNWYISHIYSCVNSNRKSSSFFSFPFALKYLRWLHQFIKAFIYLMFWSQTFKWTWLCVWYTEFLLVFLNWNCHMQILVSRLSCFISFYLLALLL